MDTIFKALGTPKPVQWKEGYKLAEKKGLNLESMNYQKQSMKLLVPTASPEAQELLKQMLKISPNKRPSAKLLLDSPLFTGLRKANGEGKLPLQFKKEIKYMSVKPVQTS